MRFSVHGAIAPRLAVRCVPCARCSVVERVGARRGSRSHRRVVLRCRLGERDAERQVNPGGIATITSSNMVTSEAYGSTTPVTSAGSGSEPAGALANLSGLASETEYHFRSRGDQRRRHDPGRRSRLQDVPVAAHRAARRSRF